MAPTAQSRRSSTSARSAARRSEELTGVSEPCHRWPLPRRCIHSHHLPLLALQVRRTRILSQLMRFLHLPILVCRPLDPDVGTLLVLRERQEARAHRKKSLAWHAGSHNSVLVLTSAGWQAEPSETEGSTFRISGPANTNGQMRPCSSSMRRRYTMAVRCNACSARWVTAGVCLPAQAKMEETGISKACLAVQSRREALPHKALPNCSGGIASDKRPQIAGRRPLKGCHPCNRRAATF